MIKVQLAVLREQDSVHLLTPVFVGSVLPVITSAFPNVDQTTIHSDFIYIFVLMYRVEASVYRNNLAWEVLFFLLLAIDLFRKSDSCCERMRDIFYHNINSTLYV